MAKRKTGMGCFLFGKKYAIIASKGDDILENVINIILVEDDEALTMGLTYSLKKEGYKVTVISSYKEGINYLNNIKNHQNMLGLFDVMLPDGNGFDLYTEYKKAGMDIPVIFLTAVSEEINIVQGLDMGADDYITKPFKVKELLSRIKAVLRRYYRSDIKGESSLIRYKNLVVDESKAVVKIVSETENIVELTSSEYRLLLYFLHNQGIVLTRNTLLEKLFDNKGTYIDDNTLSVYIRRIREKLECGKNEYIKTVHGLGYIMEKENV